MHWNESSLNKILLVEDDSVHARIMRKAFEGSTHNDQIIHYSDGESVLEALFHDQPSNVNDPNTLPVKDAGSELTAPSTGLIDSSTTNKQSLNPGEALPDNKLPSLILLDLRLPAVDGIDVLQAIRSNERTRQIPVIVVSTSERQDDIRQCYQMGANAYITKPVDYNIFIEKLRALRQFWLVSAELPDGSV